MHGDEFDNLVANSKLKLGSPSFNAVSALKNRKNSARRI